MFSVADVKEVTFKFVDGLCGREIGFEASLNGINGKINVLLPEVSGDAQVVRDLLSKLFREMNAIAAGGGFGGPAGIRK